MHGLAAGTMLRAGWVYWRKEPAARVAFLVDGQNYFAALRAACLAARRVIRIVGWDIHSRMRLVPEASDGLPAELGPFLNALLRLRRHLRIDVLIWNFAMIYSIEREALPLLNREWRRHGRLRLRFAADHPLGASHHQKIVTIDDAVAFGGGIDLNMRRWGTPEHAPHDARRCDPAGTPLPLAEASLDPWPSELAPDLPNVEVAIARTAPTFGRRPERREVEHLWCAAIAAAQHTLYIETQYLTAGSTAAALRRRLAEPVGPEIVIVLPTWVRVHSKALVVDDRLLGEHLGHAPAAVTAAVAAGGLIGGIGRLSAGCRRLLPLLDEAPADLVADGADGANLFESRQPIRLERFIDDFLPEALPRLALWWRMTGWMATALLFAALVAMWRYTPLAQLLTLQGLIDAGQGWAASPWTPLVVVGAFVLGGFVMVPVTLMITALGILFDPVAGLLYAAPVVLSSASAGFFAGRMLGRGPVCRLVGAQLSRIDHRLVVNGIVAMTLLGVSAARVLYDGDALSILLLITIILVLTALGYALQRWLGIDEATLPVRE